MEDAKIMENMKEVLKKTRKGKHRKQRVAKHSKATETVSDEAISEIMIKSWKLSSPEPKFSVQEPTNGLCLPKVNAFERLMLKKPEPLGEPEINGVKKRKYLKKPKYNKIDDDSDVTDTSLLDENKETPKITNSGPVESPIAGIMKFLQPPVSPVDKEDLVATEDVGKKKRIRVDEAATDSVDADLKTRKSKKPKLILDSNDNSIEPETEQELNHDQQVETLTHTSGRPRRSCAAIINYELLISPDKTTKLTKTPPKRVGKAKKKDEYFIEIQVADEDSPVKISKPTRKLAPLFVKKVPAPSIDPAVKEARRNFLLSGLPEEMKSSIDKQKQYEEEILGNDLVAFPSTSHVTQLKPDDEFVAQDLKTSIITIRSDGKIDDETCLNPLNYGVLAECQAGEDKPETSYVATPIERDKLSKEYLKNRLKVLKEEFKGFPTNRCFKQLYWMYQHVNASQTNSKHTGGTENGTTEENLLFINVFKPTKVENFLINVEPVKELQKFLLRWNEKTDSYDSDDSSSRTSSKGFNNFVVLSGANGSGKTCSVYALANELNYQVIEINAGTRRSGKKLLENLLEATQSHRVKDKTGKWFSSNEEETCLPENICDATGAKSIILIEDAELAFESDDGFVSSIQQLINISKRPVILTTNNRNCQHLQKFIQLNEIAYDTNRDSSSFSMYLTLMCLATGCELEAQTIEQLLASNDYDLRKTINEIEFFVRGESTSSSRACDLSEFFERPKRQPSNMCKLNYAGKSIDEICFESSIASSAGAIAVSYDSQTSYKQQVLTNEIGEYLSSRCGFDHRGLGLSKPGQIERSISSELCSQSTSLNSRKSQEMDYSPVIRDICRSEQARGETSRRAANNRGHYLRFLMSSNVLETKYLNEHCELFQ